MVKHGSEVGLAMKAGTLLARVGIGLLCSAAANASGGPDDFLGYWKTAEGDGIVQLERCPLYKDAPPTALCGTIVWDREVGNPRRTAALDCNRKVFETARFDGTAWKDGWAFDPRSKKFYQTRLTLKDGQLHVRVFVGSEINGQTDVFTRVASVPPGCEGHQPESTTVRGVGR